MTDHASKTVNVFHEKGPQVLPLGVPFVITYIGAAIYFVQQTNGAFWDVILALLQAAVWPAYVLYHVLVVLGV